MRYSTAALVGFAAFASAQIVVLDPAPGTMVPPEDAAEVELEADVAEPAEIVPAAPIEPAAPPAESDVFQGPFGFPPGIMGPPDKKDLPKFGPPKDLGKGKGMPVWHPPHKGIFIDDCDDDEADKWHWAGKKKKHPKPMIPHHKWTTSTVTATKTKTVIDCPDKHPECPGKPKTKYTTTTVEVTTTICPIPIKETPKPHPHPPKPDHPKPPHPPMPPKPTMPHPPPSYPPKPTAPPTEPEVPEYSQPPAIVTGAAPQNVAAGALAGVAAFVAALM